MHLIILKKIHLQQAKGYFSLVGVHFSYQFDESVKRDNSSSIPWDPNTAQLIIELPVLLSVMYNKKEALLDMNRRDL